MTRDATKPFNGEEQIEKTLTSNPLKLYLDVEKEFDAIRDKAQDLLWPENQDEARWSDVADRYAEQAGMPWLPPRGSTRSSPSPAIAGCGRTSATATSRKKPKKKRTSAQVIAESEPDDEGRVRLRVNPQNAGPAPRIHLRRGRPGHRSRARSSRSNPYTTTALRVNFLVCDPSGQYETGDPVTWSNKLVLRNELTEKDGKRTVELFVAPGRNPLHARRQRAARWHTLYAARSRSATARCSLRAFAEADGLEAKADFRFPAKGKKGVADRRGEAGAGSSRAPAASSTRAARPSRG